MLNHNDFGDPQNTRGSNMWLSDANKMFKQFAFIKS